MCSADLNQNESACVDEKSFKTYRKVQTESMTYKNLPKGRRYTFAVRLYKIDGYPGKMRKFPTFTVLGM